MRPSLAIATYTALFCPSAVAFAAQDVHAFDVPAQEAVVGIAEFAIQADRQIVAPSEDLVGVRTRALRGTLDTKNALALLLKDTPLSVMSDDGHMIVLAVLKTSRKTQPDKESLEERTGDRETIVVTGYRASLTSAARAKRTAISFTDSIFAEDIDKFPDSNIAESINRIPGILLTRDANGEGVQVAIRGLSTNFTKVLLNNAPIAVAGNGVIDSSNSNRQVDLNVFPGEFFTEISVTKTARAELLEGGASGTVNLRTRRPFDNPGPQVSYTLQSINNSLTSGMSGSGAVVASNTWDTDTALGTIGLLIGVAGRKAYQYNNGWEDGNAGWVTPSITNATLCGAPTGCDIPGSTVSIGGNAMTIASTVPVNVTVPGYAVGTTVNAAMLQALNPGLTMTQISNMLLPRLPRPMYQRGSRDRYNAVSSFEIRPSEALHFYLDFNFSREFRDIDRSDLNFGVRAGNGAQPSIPANVTLNADGVVTRGTFYNAQFGLEARDYTERFDFLSLNPGVTWQISDLLSVSFQTNASRSHYFGESPTIFLATCPSTPVPSYIPSCAGPAGGVIANFDNTGVVPVVSTNIDLDDPNQFEWYGGRASMMFDRRYTATYGAHLDFTYGNDELRFKGGAAYDVAYRSIVGIDRTGTWQSTLCQGGTNFACSGKSGSLILQSDLASYLYKGPDGFVAVKYDALKEASGYDALKSDSLKNVMGLCAYQPSGNGFATGTATGATSGCFEERTSGFYGQWDGTVPLAAQDFRYDIGLRWVQTRQDIRSPVSLTSGDYTFSNAEHTYAAFLPSINLSYEAIDGFVVRASWSRTMTRANVTQMISTVNFTDLNAASASLGNPTLRPYFANNIDLALELYTGDEGYLSLAYFRKDISGFSVSQIRTQPFSYLSQFGITWTTLSSVQKSALTARAGCTSDIDCNATIYVTQQVNAPGVETINGLEFTYVQPFDFLLAQYGLKGFGLTANATLIDQNSSGSAAVHATDVAPYSLNLTGYYEANGFMARLSYTFRDRTYGTSSNAASVCLPTTQASAIGCPEGAYLFNAPYGQADFSSSIKLSWLVGTIPSDPEFTFNVQNLFNAKQVSYFQFRSAPSRYYRSGQTLMLGLHGNF